MQTGISVPEPRSPFGTADDGWRREELGRFLRDCRGRLTPHDVGLPSHGFRRVRGLRREEVAELAEVSVTWYTCFELGTAHRVSLQFVDRVADVLRLDATEKTYLFALLGAPLEPAPAERRESLEAIVRGEETSAIAGVDGGLGMLFQNDTWRRLFVNGATGGAVMHENLLDCIFADPGPHEGAGDWAVLGGFACGALRMQRARGHAGAAAAFARYAANPAFSAQWDRRTLYDPQDADVRFTIAHPAIGVVALRLLGVGLFHTANMLFVVIGDGEAAARRIRSLHEQRPGAHRNAMRSGLVVAPPVVLRAAASPFG